MGVAGRGDDMKNMRLWLNVEEGGTTMKQKVDNYHYVVVELVIVVVW